MENFKINDQEATVENLIEAGYRRYRGEEMDIYYNANICEHVGECVRGNPAVWEVGESLGYFLTMVKNWTISVSSTVARLVH